jgi:perosamine synthetase
MLTPTTTPLFKVFQPDTIVGALQETLFSGFIAEGAKTAEFTRLVGEFVGNPRTVVMNSCTMALTIAYRLCGVEPGTEVISTPLTCVASNQPVLSLGARVVWADVDRGTGMLTAETIEPCITDRTRAILVLHKEGHPARMDEILSLARPRGIKVIEDAAHAFGAMYKGRSIGAVGDIACFSFQAVKHITTGDGGALTCRSEEDYLRARRLKWFGVDRDARTDVSAWEQDVPEWGYKGNMNDIAATIGIEQIAHARRIVDVFHANGARYTTLLQGIPGLTTIPVEPGDFETYWAYCLVVENRQALVRKLAEHGVASGQIHPRNDIYSMFGDSRRPLPNTDYFSARELCIPCGWWVGPEEQARIAGIIRSGW